MFVLLVGIHLLFLAHDSLQHCSDGIPKECLEADFAPGTNLGGEGFDITKMEQKGVYVINMNKWRRKDKTCTLCSNPFLENKKQKLPLSVVDWRAKSSCSAKVKSQLHKSSESLLNSNTASIENNWKSSLDISVGAASTNLMLAGTQSKIAEYSMAKSKEDKYSFATQSMACEYYRYRVSTTPTLHHEFRQAISQLPKTYTAKTKQQFYGFINKFGTHYITMVRIGGSVKSVTSIRECEASLEGLSAEEVQACLEVEASASYIRTEAKAESKHCKSDIQKSEKKSSFASSFNDRFTEIRGGHTTEPDLLFSADKEPSAYKDWLSTLPQHPDILSYSLDPLHQLLPRQSPSHSNLRSAISHYILEKGLWRNCSSSCSAGVRTNSRDSCVCQCHNNAGVNQDCCPTQKGLARVVITVQRAENLWGDTTTATDAYVKVYRGKTLWRTNVIWNNNNPHFQYVIDWGDVNLLAGNKVRFEVWDEDNKWDDDLLGECDGVLTVGVKTDVCNLQHGRLFVKWQVQCAPNLSGDLCTVYKATPMSPSLKGWFKSRHSHPVPEALLLQWGVFVNGSKSNQTRV
uniref:Uncharacterized protein n=1 Tax=Periophthalmus magnuspinnatus TaxID=409849 RepID=A0A3B4A353_9GOBI